MTAGSTRNHLLLPGFSNTLAIKTTTITFSLKYNTIGFLFILISGWANSQTARKDYCLWDDFSLLPESNDYFITYIPAIGITLTGKQDSVFCFTTGTVTTVHTFNSSFCNVTIKTGHNSFVEFAHLKTTLVNIGDKITSGQYVGDLTKHEGRTYLHLVISKRHILFGRAKNWNYLKKFCRRRYF